MKSLSQTKINSITLLIFLLALLFYGFTMQPSLAWGDGVRLQREAITAESFIFAEMVDVEFAPDPFPFARLGVAAWDHPLYVVLGHLLVRALPQVSSLRLVNWVSVIFGAATIALLFNFSYRHTRRLFASLFAAGSLAVSHTFWWHAATPEVYTLLTFLLLLTVDMVDRYQQNGRYPTLLWAAFFFGLSLSNHLLTILLLPAFLVNQALFHRHTLRRPPGGLTRRHWRQFIGVGLAFAAGFALYLIQTLRLMRTFSPVEMLGPAAGSTFLRGSLALTPALLGQSILLYVIFLLYQFGVLGLILGGYGWWNGRRSWPVWWGETAVFYLVYLVFGLVYGVSDQFAFFQTAHLFWAVAIGMGVAQLETILSRRRKQVFMVLATLLLLLMPVFYQIAPDGLRRLGVTDADFGIPQIGVGLRDGLAYYLNPNKRGDMDAEKFGRETLAALPPDALVLAEWYTDTDEYFVLRYFIAVENLREDVEMMGWPTADPFQFDSSVVATVVETAVSTRPVYLASLDEQFYAVSRLAETYCIVPEANLYRLYPLDQATDKTCLP